MCLYLTEVLQNFAVTKESAVEVKLYHNKVLYDFNVLSDSLMYEVYKINT